MASAVLPSPGGLSYRGMTSTGRSAPAASLAVRGFWLLTVTKRAAAGSYREQYDRDPLPGATMIGSILELVIFSVPSVLYMRAARRRGRSPRDSRAAVGWQTGDAAPYGLAIAITAALLPVTYLALRAISNESITTSAHLHVTYGRASTVGGYVAIALLALAEEVLFRGFVAGIAFRRYGFAAGNVIQAFVFLAPHLLLLLVSTALWPLLPLQLLAGWLLGVLRWKSSSVGPGAVAHIAANVLAPLLLLL